MSLFFTPSLATPGETLPEECVPLFHLGESALHECFSSTSHLDAGLLRARLPAQMRLLPATSTHLHGTASRLMELRQGSYAMRTAYDTRWAAVEKWRTECKTWKSRWRCFFGCPEHCLSVNQAVACTPPAIAPRPTAPTRRMAANAGHPCHQPSFFDVAAYFCRRRFGSAELIAMVGGPPRAHAVKEAAVRHAEHRDPPCHQPSDPFPRGRRSGPGAAQRAHGARLPAATGRAGMAVSAPGRWASAG